MKKLLLILCLLPLVMVSCDKDDKPEKKTEPGLMHVHVKKELTKSGAAQNGCPTPAEVIKRAHHFVAMDGGMWGKDAEANLGIAEECKDYENNIIKVWGDYVVKPRYKDSEWVLEIDHYDLLDSKPYHIICRHNWRVCDRYGNILAYIPDEQFINARSKIRKLFDEGKYQEIYDLLQETFTAIPITEEAYNELEQSKEPGQ